VLKVPQSLIKVYVHLVFSTKYRMPLIPDDIRREMHAYMGGVLTSKGCYPVEINSEPDHVHILFISGRTHSFAQVVSCLKTSATHWIRAKDPTKPHSFWQRGYGAFSISMSEVDRLRWYIRRQREHHRGTTYKEEFRNLLNTNNLDYDERYVWD